MLSRISQIDVQLLQVFCTVAECGGFTAAQVELNVSQPTISNKISALESRLGMRLCERGRSGFRLTPQGQGVYEAAKNMFAAHESFTRAVATLSGRVEGDLHLGVIDSTVTNPSCPVVGALRRLKAREKAVRLFLHVASPLEIERAVVDGRIELGVGYFPNRTPALIYQSLFEEEHQLYCGRAHPLFGRFSQVCSNELSRYEFVQRGYFPVGHSTLPRGAGNSAIVMTMEAVVTLILTGLYLGHLPLHYADQWVAKGEMTPVGVSDIRHAAPFELVQRKGQSLSLAARAFTEDIHATLATASRSIA